jgi:hypothetical protein
VPFALVNFAHIGSFAGPHISTSLVGLGDAWLSNRWQRIDLWFLPEARVLVPVLVLVALAWIGPVSRSDLRIRQVVALLGAGVIAIAAFAGLFDRESLWNAFPAAALLLVPFRNTAHTRSIWLIAIVSVAAIVLTSAHDGGAQWGPRFLLITAPALLILAAAAASDALGSGKARPIRVALVVTVILAGVWTTRAAYRELRGTKQFYARLVRAVEMGTDRQGYVISNVWWFDQVAASLYETRTFLFAEDPSWANRILRELSAAGIPKVALVWTREADGFPLDSAVADTCYRIVDVQSIEERSLTLASARCPR